MGGQCESGQADEGRRWTVLMAGASLGLLALNRPNALAYGAVAIVLIVLEAFAGHWRGAPKIKTVVFKPIPDDAVRVAALQNGEIDIAVNIPPHLGSIIDKHPKLFLSTAPSIRTIQLMFYTHEFDTKNKLVGPYQGPTADKRVRQAITYALDVDEIVKGVLDGKAMGEDDPYELRNLKERVEMLGGSFQYEGQEGLGTRAIIEAPILHD